MTIITKEEYAVIPESLKSKFIASGDGFALVEEDVEGLKKSKAEILAEKKALADKLAGLEKFKNEYEQSKSADEEAKMKQAGEFAELEKRLKDKIAETEATAAQEKASLLETFKIEKLRNDLTARGVLANASTMAARELIGALDLMPTGTGFEWKVKNGIGDSKEFDQLVEQQKAVNPFLFGSTLVTGSGAPAGEQPGGGGSQKWESLSRNEKTAAIRAANGDMEAAQKLYK
jgi:hypothetical protein